MKKSGNKNRTQLLRPGPGRHPNRYVDTYVATHSTLRILI